MNERDICVLYEEPKDSGGFFGASYHRFNVAELTASGKVRMLHEGEWIKSKYSSSGGYPKELIEAWAKNERIVASLLADGWIRLGEWKTVVGETPMFYRDTRVDESEIISLEARIGVVNEFIQSGAREELARELLEALQVLRDLPGPASSSESLVFLLERLAELHRAGDLSDEEFELAKRKALGT